jgi:quercetin dioxygenase-like cupin family protein
MSFFKETDLKSKPILNGISLRAVSGDHTMLTFFEFEPHAVIPMHRHSQEQITYVLAGEIEFELEGKRRILRKGEGVVIPSLADHGAKVLDKRAKALDAWYPIREDYL